MLHLRILFNELDKCAEHFLPFACDVLKRTDEFSIFYCRFILHIFEKGGAEIPVATVRPQSALYCASMLAEELAGLWIPPVFFIKRKLPAECVDINDVLMLMVGVPVYAADLLAGWTDSFCELLYEGINSIYKVVYFARELSDSIKFLASTPKHAINKVMEALELLVFVIACSFKGEIPLHIYAETIKGLFSIS
jgi:hypothetical protein